MAKNKFQLDKEIRLAMQEKIKKFFLNERDEEIGDLAAIIVLDFIIEKLAPDFYNLGIRDCISYEMQSQD